MAKSWKKRLRRGRLARWLGRIEGVEKPALLVGIGMLLYRVWRNEERKLALGTRWRSAINRVRRRFGDRSDRANGAGSAGSTSSSPAPRTPPA